MATVKPILFGSLQLSDMVENVLKLMRDHRLKAILVIDDSNLVSIVSQGFPLKVKHV